MSQEPQSAEIIIDDREPGDLVSMLLSRNASARKARLFLADILIGESIAIERKARSDLESSIADGRLFSQLSELKETFSTAILVVEGTEKFERINRNALIAALSSAALENISVFFTRNLEETAELIYWLARKSADRNSPKPLAHRKPKTERENAFALIQALPGVSIKLSENIAENFSNIKELANSPIEDLQKVQKIGKKKALRIFNVFNLKLKD